MRAVYPFSRQKLILEKHLKTPQQNQLIAEQDEPGVRQCELYRGCVEAYQWWSVVSSLHCLCGHGLRNLKTATHWNGVILEIINIFTEIL